MAEQISVKDVQFYMRNVRTRMPFKYGVAVLTSVPILHVIMEAELADGTLATGVAADILPPKWFDKDPAKEYEDNVDDLLFVAQAAAQAYKQASAHPKTVFEIWWEGYAATLAAGDGRQLNHLTASHGSTLMERALIDAVGTGRGLSYYALLKSNELALDFGRIHGELRGLAAADVIAEQPVTQFYIRHTVGLADPIWTADLAADERLDDGLPQSLQEYIDVQDIVYFKIKVNGDIENDLERLRAIAALVDRHERQYYISLDGNEQYKDMDSFLELLARIEEDKRLQRFYASVLYIEQPLERSIALNSELAAGIRSVSAQKPMLVDESDGDLDVFKKAVELGYLGVSSKNCKGMIKALANLALVQKLNNGETRYFLSGEDLMNLPVVPLQQDLAHLAVLGVTHAERNGHHYVRGLDHLSEKERQACRELHGPLYRQTDDATVLDIRQGRIDISSLQVPGLGVGMPVDVEAMVPLAAWSFASLA
jgi:hypothetical protein